MGAEDWSYVMQEIPAMMTFLGACPWDWDPLTSPGNHSNLVQFNEQSMAVGIALHGAVALYHSGHVST